MIITSDKLRTTAINYLGQLNGVSDHYRTRIADTLVKTILESPLKEIPKNDFKLMVNQFYNLVCFGPISMLELILTEDCNLACDYCFVREKNHKKMSLDTIFSAINFLTYYSGDLENLNITLFGGEPLLEKENIYRIVDYCDQLESKAKSKRIGISITTNGTLIEEEFLKRTHSRIRFLLSIDGDEKTHDLYRKYKNGSGTFKTVVSKIKLLKKYQPWLGARMTVLPGTASHLYSNVTGLYNLGINQFMIGPAMDAEWNNDSLRSYELQLRKLGEFHSKKKKNREPFRMNLFEKTGTAIECHEHQWGCGAGRSTISVNTDGDIYPCSKFLGYEKFKAPEVKLGNINAGITNIALRKRMSVKHKESFPGCSSCKEINACMGGCPADNFYLHRDIDKAGKAHCELKKIENSILRDYNQEQ